jgi:acyl-CoA thioester hydrolase
MGRIKIQLPETFPFTTSIQIRITDLNYGGHVGNDTILSLIHEARIQFLRAHGYTELDMAGPGLIMNDVAIEYKAETFYGDVVKISVAVGDFSKVSFDFYYKIEKESEAKTILVAYAKTGVVCFDYVKKKVMAIPEEARSKFGG